MKECLYKAREPLCKKQNKKLDSDCLNGSYTKPIKKKKNFPPTFSSVDFKFFYKKNTYPLSSSPLPSHCFSRRHAAKQLRILTFGQNRGGT